MALIVQKYGGTSVKDSDRLREVAKWVVKNKAEGNQMVVVVSAPGGMTDSLIKRAEEVHKTPSGRELDRLLSVGEQISASLLAMAIGELGYKAVSLTGPQLEIKTTNEFNNAKILGISSEKIVERLEAGYIVIVTGFQGIDEDGSITTLGRGGSDTTAVAVGAAISADQVEIYTDVDGVYTADPRIVEDARKLSSLSFIEMIEMAGKGAKVLHCRSVELAAKYGIDIHLRSAFSWEEGTWIRGSEKMEKAAVRGITHVKGVAKITVDQLESNGSLGDVMDVIEARGSDILLINQGLTREGQFEISLLLKEEEAVRVAELLRERLGGGNLSLKPSLGMVSAVGIGIRSNRLQGRVARVVNNEEMRVEMISSSETSLSYVVEGAQVDRLKKLMHYELIEKSLSA
ncbi:aspartokinase [Propionigenium maris DSM 9537]|uniref:Aspartokinase n=1 Tax=Propionigenium maris DSM 9537 TaxID=1123000 RepID=A0A9W6LN74_9FUSO|nr:aspartate kinase [Propionigenium maris]GLI56298.1 aspartokinase [Propionigenium maris DSM 9537]